MFCSSVHKLYCSKFVSDFELSESYFEMSDTEFDGLDFRCFRWMAVL